MYFQLLSKNRNMMIYTFLKSPYHRKFKHEKTFAKYLKTNFYLWKTEIVPNLSNPKQAGEGGGRFAPHLVFLPIFDTVTMKFFSFKEKEI